MKNAPFHYLIPPEK